MPISSSSMFNTRRPLMPSFSSMVMPSHVSTGSLRSHSSWSSGHFLRHSLRTFSSDRRFSLATASVLVAFFLAGFFLGGGGGSASSISSSTSSSAASSSTSTSSWTTSTTSMGGSGSGFFAPSAKVTPL